MSVTFLDMRKQLMAESILPRLQISVLFKLSLSTLIMIYPISMSILTAGLAFLTTTIIPIDHDNQKYDVLLVEGYTNCDVIIFKYVWIKFKSI